MGKRANGEGSIYRDGKKWRAALTVGINPETGKPIRRSRKCKSQADAREALKELQLEFDEQQQEKPPEIDPLTVREFLDTWLENHVKPERAVSTFDNYSRTLRKWVIPYIGETLLSDLVPRGIDSLLAEIRQNGAGGRTVQNTYVVLNAALGYAVSPSHLIPVNPCEEIKKPKHEREEPFPFTKTESRQILQAVTDDRLYSFYLVAFSTGLRSAELFGLEWSQVDLKGQMIRVVKQATTVSGKLVVKKPKSKAGTRTVEIGKKVVESLQEHRKRLLIEGLASCDLVFPSPQGQHMRRGNLRTRHWMPLLQKLNLNHRGFHHVRHTYATQQLLSGLSVHVLSRILGHAKPSTTLDIYAHWVPDQQSEATAKVDGWLG